MGLESINATQGKAMGMNEGVKRIVDYQGRLAPGTSENASRESSSTTNTRTIQAALTTPHPADVMKKGTQVLDDGPLSSAAVQMPRMSARLTPMATVASYRESAHGAKVGEKTGFDGRG